MKCFIALSIKNFFFQDSQTTLHVSRYNSDTVATICIIINTNLKSHFRAQVENTRYIIKQHSKISIKLISLSVQTKGSSC